LIQGVLDYDYGWANSIHDWAFLQIKKKKKLCDEGQVLTLQIDRMLLIQCSFGSTFFFKDEKNKLPR
jgi:hypothetical protein